MGLNERRQLQLIKDDILKTKAQIKEVSKNEIDFDIDIDSFPEEEEILKNYFVYRIYGAQGVVDAMKLITRDEMGKEAIKEGIHSIQLVNSATQSSTHGDRSVYLKDGNLKITVSFAKDPDAHKHLWKPEDLQKEIEKLL